MRVKISQAQLCLLEESPETMDLVAKFLVRNPAPALEGSGYPLAELREACADVLIRIGFDEGYKINAHGTMLEDLIDKLFE